MLALLFVIVSQDWRAHYEQMHTHKESIDATLSDTKVYLDKLHQEISKTLEKVASREKYINNQVLLSAFSLGALSLSLSAFQRIILCCVQ